MERCKAMAASAPEDMRACGGIPVSGAGPADGFAVAAKSACVKRRSAMTAPAVWGAGAPRTGLPAERRDRNASRGLPSRTSAPARRAAAAGLILLAGLALGAQPQKARAQSPITEVFGTIMTVGSFGRGSIVGYSTAYLPRRRELHLHEAVLQHRPVLRPRHHEPKVRMDRHPDFLRHVHALR